jgi:hypothetical protein
VRVRRFPGLVEADRLRDGVELRDGEPGGHQRPEADRKEHALVALVDAVEAQDLIGLAHAERIVGIRPPRTHVLRIRGELHFVRKGFHPIVALAEPGSADRHDRAVLQGLVPDAAADAVARFQHGDGLVPLDQVARRRQSGEAGAHYADIDITTFHQRLLPAHGIDILQRLVLQLE